MLEINTQPIPAQIIKTVLDGQNVQINIYQKPQGLFIDINSDGKDLANGILCWDAVLLLPREYESFSGNFIFVDTQGTDYPSYSLLGSRFKLVYLSKSEYELI